MRSAVVWWSRTSADAGARKTGGAGPPKMSGTPSALAEGEDAAGSSGANVSRSGTAASHAWGGGGPSASTSTAPTRPRGFFNSSLSSTRAPESSNSAPWASSRAARRTCSVEHLSKLLLMATQIVLPCWKTTAPGPVHLGREPRILDSAFELPLGFCHT